MLLTGHAVAMVTYYVTKMLTTRSPMAKVILDFMQRIPSEKNLTWIKRDLFMIFWKPENPFTRSTCSELWRRFRNVWLQTWLIFCPYKMLLAGLCIDYSVKQARWVKPEVMCSSPESTSQLIPNQGKTGASGGPKWRQIWMFLKLIKKLLCLNQNFFRRSSLGVYRKR